MSFEEKVKYIIGNVQSTDDCYYIIKSLFDSNTKECCETENFLDSTRAFKVFVQVHKEGYYYPFTLRFTVNQRWL